MNHRSNPAPPPSTSTNVDAFAADRWATLARGVEVSVDEPVVVALSGGADSVYLLRVLAASDPRPRVVAVHVDHGLRGEASRADARFCADVCDELGVPLRVVSIALDPDGPSLEARAREARYAALCAEARAADARVVATGHHADDAVETLLLRWIRGTAMEGLSGLERRLVLDGALHATPTARANAATAEAGRARTAREEPLVIVRPLLALRREEVRRALVAHGFAWREDGSNADARFARNRVRNVLVPRLLEFGGPQAIENLRAFGRAVEELEERCAERTADLTWSPPAHAAARRGVDDAHLGGTIARARLMPLPRALQRRVLWRLLCEGTGAAPARAVLTRLVDDLDAGRTTVHALRGGWILRLRSDALHLEPPAPRHVTTEASDVAPTTSASQQLELYPRRADEERVLAIPGRVTLGDGRAIAGDTWEVSSSADVERDALSCELDLDRLRGPLVVRFPRRGDRFHGLGAPGSKPLTRFLADAGVPREGRARVPLVVAGDEIVWVAGLRPCHAARVVPATRRRLVLRLEHPRLEREPRRREPRAPKLPFDPERTRETPLRR